MTTENFAQLSRIKDFLINEFNGADDFVKKRISILLKDEHTTHYKCSECGHKFEANDEDSFKSGIVMFTKPDDIKSI